MEGYSATDVFTQEEKQLLAVTQEIVNHLPTHAQLRCFEVATIVVHLLARLPKPPEALLVAGYYGCVEHCFIVLKSGRVLDPYVVGSLPQVQLREAAVPGATTYRTNRSPNYELHTDLVRICIEDIGNRLPYFKPEGAR